MKKNILTVVTVFATALCVFADEGMWLVNDLKGMQKELCGAVVSYDFMGTGSLVSDQGLVITNHHVVYSDVYALSSEESNYLENGFCANERKDELPIPGRRVQILSAMLDVTEETEELLASGAVKPGPMAIRKLGSIMEKRYEEKYGKTAILSSMWRGSKYYISLYDEYRDVRLVMAPPQIIGAFGGDTDNWEWPQHKGDFSFVRIYTAPDGSPAEYSPENVPLHSEKHLKVSLKGVKQGTKTMVMGYPGHTNRYAGSAYVDFTTNVTLPVSVEVRGAQMDIIRKWMNADETVRLKYADRFFSLSNAQELYSGQVMCNRRFNVVDEKKDIEKELKAWIAADPERTERWGGICEALEHEYSATDIERQFTYFRECTIRSSKISPMATRMASVLRSKSPERYRHLKKSIASDFAAMDMRVEREIFRAMLEMYMGNVDDRLKGPFQKELAYNFGNDYDAMCEYLWDCSWLTNADKVAEFADSGTDLSESLGQYCEDPLVRYFNDNKMGHFNSARDRKLGGSRRSALATEYTAALYRMRMEKGIRQYPDANSTLRISYGKVCGYSPCDAVDCRWNSTVAGLLEKHNPEDHDFDMPERWREVLKGMDSRKCVNFITDNDITGGNSGSPVMNRRGELVGLCFDGNKESLASDVSFTPGYNRCICVDIRFVLDILKYYTRSDALLEEIL